MNMAVLPFSWPLDLEFSRVRTLYGSADDPVLPYEPPSTVIKVSKFKLGEIAGTEWILQFEHAKIYDQSFYGQQEKVALLLERDTINGGFEVEGHVELFDLSAHKRLTETNFDCEIDNGQKSINITLDITMCDFSYAVFENSQMCLQGFFSIDPIENSEHIDSDQTSLGQIVTSEIHMIGNNPLIQLSHDFSSLLDDATFSDLAIKCGDTTVHAHKGILSVRSPVFSAMFRSPMKEGKENELNVTDIELPVLQKMLAFIYSSQVKDLTMEMACDLLFAGDKYQLTGLVAICVEFLKFNLTKDNAVRILTVADLYDVGLKDYALNYLGHYFSEVENLNEWKQLKTEKQSLAIEVLERVVSLGGKNKLNN